MANRWGKNRSSDRLYFLGLQSHCRQWLEPWNYKMLAPWKESHHKLRQCFIKQRHYFADKHPSSQSYGFSSSHVWMWEPDHKEVWAPKNWCFWIAVLEKTLESSLDCREIKLVHPKGNQPWIFIGRTEVEALIFWSPDAKSQLIGKNVDAGKDWREEEKRAAEDEMVKRHHWLNGREFEQTLGDSEDRGAWCATLHGVTNSWTWLSDWTTTSMSLFCFVIFVHLFFRFHM